MPLALHHISAINEKSAKNGRQSHSCGVSDAAVTERSD